jgi:hypothetical protein
MLIKTTHDDLSDHHFISFQDDTDTQQDYDITKMYYKIWAINTGNKMLKTINVKKSNKEGQWYNI